MHRLNLILVVVLLFVGAACKDREPERAPNQGEQRAASPDAFCNEHGVLEAVCTKCNPALIPVFKAKGDWCEEHGFPESICPICHPERGGRPAAAVSGQDGPAEGTKVRFKTRETARLAGIRTVKAVARPTTATVTAPARIVYDATRLARLNARSPGVVRTIRADVGARVRAGAALAVIESASVGSDVSGLRAARARLEVAERDLERKTRLQADGIVPERDVLAARRDLEEARAAVSASSAALGVVGSQVDASGRYTLTSPIAGVVTQRTATIGQLVGGDQMLFEVVDTSVVWAEIDVPESETSNVAVGQRVTIHIDGLGERALSGDIEYVAPEIDARTRTTKARIRLPNPDGALRANMFGEAGIAVTRSREAVLVPRVAIQRARNVELVFVRQAEDVFEARRVRRGASDGDLVEVSGSVRPGDDIATEGSFLLKTETVSESIGAGCCDVEQGH